MSEQVAVTGANGYVGSILCSAFAAAGYRVIRLQRPSSSDHIPYSLEHGPSEALPTTLSAIIHCAYDLQLRERADIERVNLGGTKKLAALGIPLVHISSMSAYAGTQQIYGQTKLACEDVVASYGGTSLRLGLVHGGPGGGMISALQKMAALPLVPNLRPDSYQYTVHADDVARCVLATVAKPPPHRVIGVANPRRVPFSEIMRTLRTAATNKPLRTVPIRSGDIHRLLKTIEGMGLRAGFRADSMLGLMRPAPEVLHGNHWQQIGISFRDFTEVCGNEASRSGM